MKYTRHNTMATKLSAYDGAVSVGLLALLAAGTLPAQQRTAAQERFLNALIQVESSGRDDAVGDGGKAIGCLQIWRPYWQDAVQRSGIKGTYRDCFNRVYAKRIAEAYMLRYARKAWINGDWEVCARIHNGGPRGHKKKATINYWRKVQKHL